MATRLGLEAARALVEAMLQAASEMNLRFAAAVVDAGGELVFMARMDGASALNARMAVNKAYTASKWGQDTKALKERLFDMSLGDNRRDIAWFGDERFTAVWGGDRPAVRRWNHPGRTGRKRRITRVGRGNRPGWRAGFRLAVTIGQDIRSERG